ncbi:MAG: iron complex outermembrane recepter protein [Candidatus Magnetoglobus multicellularis str. Araruama]|uniref:Iron complex outermembrane recepter protein n=1 Tax=Candidatus Magnetoglobus multicellularis str. Araruama TaxID=890399 RepID=A0A1V1P6F1_9BACT|nr:MAG: iron complex outermembrane recepter protein [Candidatus Magnetoglobus multicellularis str. Araruama]
MPDYNNWQSIRGGVRFDWDDSDTFMSIEASVLEENMMEEMEMYGLLKDSRFRERYIMSKFEKSFANHSSIQLNLYYDYIVRNTLLYAVEKEERCDIDFQHIFYINPYNRLTWGLGYRYVTDRIDPDAIFSFDRLTWSRSITSAFIQHKWSLVPDYFIMTMGSKFEYNEFTGYEQQPGIKLVWLPSDRHSTWVSVSKAVRTPARIDLNADMPTKKGNPDLESEELTAYEVGYRTDAIKNIRIDISAFYNEYDQLRRMATSEDGFTIIPDNEMTGETYGFECALNWVVLMNTRYINKWTLSNTWSFIRLNMHQLDQKHSTTEGISEGNNPRNMVTCHSKMDIFDNFQFDIALKYVEALSEYEIPTYIKTDMRLNYKLSENIQCQLIAQNIQDPAHPEYLPFEIKRTLFGKVVIQY